MNTNRTFLAAALVASLAVLLLAGCGATPEALPNRAQDLSGVALSGTVFGGQQPINGAHVYVMSVGTTGYASAATSLLTSGVGTDSVGTYVTTSATGSFDLTGKYTCTPGVPVYVLAMGGNPGLSGTVNNTAANMFAVLGACPSGGTFAGQIPSVQINELSTVAGGYAMSPFASDALHIGTSGTTSAVAGILNAMSSAMQIVSSYYAQDVKTTTPAISGYTGALSANGTIPASKINTIADILAACVNSDGTTGNTCSTLFANTKNAAGTTPTDVATAAMNMAANPSKNVANLFNLIPTQTVFQPLLASAPTDWTLAVTYTAPNTSTPTRAAVDGSGNLWFPNYGNNTLTELNPLGAVMSGTSGFTSSTMGSPWAVGIKPSTGSIMVANGSSNYISVFNSSGTGTGQFGTLFNAAMKFYSITFNYDGNTFMGTDQGTQNITVLGQIVSASGTGTMYGAAVNASGTLYGTSNAGNALVTGTSSFTGGGLNGPTGIAMDKSNNFWIANGGATVLSEFNSSGAALSSTGFSGGGLNTSWGVAVDGDGKVFVSNGNGTLSEFAANGTAMSPSTGYKTGSTGGIYSVVIDNAGNAWAPATDGKIYKYIGLAAPVVVPLTSNKVGIRP